MNYILFDDDSRIDLLPLTFTRPIADIRTGILTLREKWQKYLGAPTSSLTEPYLSKKFPLVKGNDNLLINGSVFPEEFLVEQIQSLSDGEALVFEKVLIAVRQSDVTLKSPDHYNLREFKSDKHKFRKLRNSWDVFAMNGQAINDDFVMLSEGRKSQPLSATNFLVGDPDQVFVEEGATVEHAFLNTTAGPIYIGKNATVMEGAKIRGPFALCDHATLKMDAKIYEATTIGPHCKIGGEVQNTVFFGYSNKAHDGYLGNAVIGEWCNLGADTNNSNLKNTYDIVKLWSYRERKFVSTGLQFCGLIMGDHSKSGINTMFNTGTVVGVSCNLYGSGFQRNYIPSFSWGSPVALKLYDSKKAYEVATAVMKRRGMEFDGVEKDMLEHILHLSEGERR